MFCRQCLHKLRLAGVFSSTINQGKALQPSAKYGTSFNKRLEKLVQKEETIYHHADKKRALRVYVWGYAATGALGVRTFLDPKTKKHHKVRTKQLSPHRLEFMDMYDLKTYDLACGYGFTVYLCNTETGQVVYGTGLNTDSQLGYQEYPLKSGRILDYVTEPAPLALPLQSPEATQLTHVSCGRAHTIIVTDKEGVFSLGNNAYGQCGRSIVENEKYRGSQTINKVLLDGKIKQVECGQDHSLFLTEAGQIYSCGMAADGQTGLGHYDCVGVPSLVRGDIEGENIVHMASRGDTVLAVSDRGDVFGWGNSEYNQLNSVVHDETQVCEPRRLPFTDVGKVVKVAAAGSMCAVLNDKGQVHVWGFGILGKGPNLEESDQPQHIPPTLFGFSEFNPEVTVVDIKCGLNHFAVINNVGDLYIWGKNTRACLGLGNLRDQFFPLKVQVPAEVTQVRCGVDHNVAVCKSFA